MPKATSNVNRLPSCDACKLRKVRCDPVPPPASCSHCSAKGIICTANAVRRRRPKERPGQRIEEARARFGDTRTADSSTPTKMTTLTAARHLSPVVRAESSIVDLEVSGDLILHLLQLYSRIPRTRPVPCNFLISAFESSGRRLASLPPSTQTLALAVSAISSRLSSHPVLFGSGPPPPALSRLLSTPMSVAPVATYEFGKRRVAACEKLMEMALEHAWKSKVLNSNSDEAMAVCFLLQFLEYRRGGGGANNIWKAAFSAHLRQRFMLCHELSFDDILNSQSSAFVLFTSMPSTMPWSPRDQDMPDNPKPFESQVRGQGQPHPASSPSRQQRQSDHAPDHVSIYDVSKSSDPYNAKLVSEDKSDLQEMRLQWSMQLMWDALTCAWQNRVCDYTLHDEALLWGPPPPSLPELVAQVSTECVRWWDPQGFTSVIRPFTYHITRIALSAYDWPMRRKSGLPFSFTRLSEHLADLKHLHFLLSVVQARYVMAYSPEAAEVRAGSRVRNSSKSSSEGWTEAGYLPKPTESQDREQSSTSKLMGRNMLKGMRTALGSVNIPLFEDLQKRVSEASPNSNPNDADMPKLVSILHTYTRVLIPWGQYVMRTTLAGAHLAWLMYLGNHPFLFWCELLLHATPIEDGGDVLTRAEKLACLETMSENFAVVAWSWPAAFERPIRGEVARAIEDIKIAQALDDRLNIGALGSDARCTRLEPKNSIDSPEEPDTPLDVLEDLPDIEAAMRDAGVMDLIKGGGPCPSDTFQTNMDHARDTATSTSSMSLFHDTFANRRSSTSASAATNNDTNALASTYVGRYGYDDGQYLISSSSTGMQMQMLATGVATNSSYAPSQDYVHGADMSEWDGCNGLAHGHEYGTDGRLDYDPRTVSYFYR